MRLPWLEEREESWARRAALLPLDGLALLYGGGAWLDRFLHRRGLLPRVRLGCRVVSVGSLMVGGSGKTPTAAALARGLHRRGYRVAIASRGYGRRMRAPVVVVSDGRHVRSRVEEAGDEPMLLAAHAPGVPVLVAARRALAGQRAISSFGTEVLLLDDGFQHHPLERDVDILVFDGALGLGNRRVLPRGPLREPRRAVRLASAIGALDAPLPVEDEALLHRLAPQARAFQARRRPVFLRPLGGGERDAPALLEGREVGLLAGIGRPASLRRSVGDLGARVVAERRFPDHHLYRPGDLRGLGAQAPLWITTEKDALKIHPRWAGGIDLRVLGIEVEIEEERKFLEWLASRL